jgi:hypothetical protein
MNGADIIIGNEHIAVLVAQYLWLIVLLVIWELCWKAVALWKSARSNQLPWFVAIMVINSAGILPILYIVFFQKKKKRK